MSEEIKNNIIAFDLDKINRIEVINHAENKFEIGRMLVLYENLGHFKGLDISIQDDGKTMKIFLKNKK